MKKLKQANQYPLTFIHSGAGYGKSTALSLFVNEQKGECSWYTITAGDDDIIPFIHYLVHSIRKRFNSFGDEILHYLEDFKAIRELELEFLNALFIKECATIDRETIIVLDDYHLVDHSFSINLWLEKLIGHLPEHIHFVISSRTKPKWNSLPKWKVTGKLLEIDESELTLDEEELDVLYQDFYGIHLNTEQLEALYQLTEGWAIALSMIAEQLVKGTVLDSILNYQHSSMDELFQYLAMEVFTKHSPVLQSFIEQVSVMEEITPSLCDEILGMDGCEYLLETLVNQNSFIYKLDGTVQYRFHSLFKAAVEKRFKETEPALYKQINQKLAQYFEHCQQWENALIHYEKIQNFERMASLLERAAPDLLQAGKLESLMEKFKKIPVSIKDRYRSLWFYDGEVLRYLSYYEKAKSCYLQLIRLSDEKEDWHLKGKAYEGLAQIYIDTIQPGIAERYLTLAIETMEEKLGKNHEEIRHLYVLRLENLVNSGQAKRAEKWVKREHMPKEFLLLNNLDARIYLRTGKLEKAKELLVERVLAGRSSLPQTHRETEILLSFIESCLGNTQDAKRWAQKGIKQGSKHKNLFVEACGWMRLGHAWQLGNDFDFQKAEECYLTSLDIMDKIHIPRGKAEPYMGLCLLYSKKGDYELSQKYGELALYETEKAHDRWLSAFIRLSMGIAAFNCKRWLDAENYFTVTEGNFKQIGDPYGLMLTSLWKAFLYQREEKWEPFKESIAKFLQEAQIGNYEFIFFKPTTYGPKDLQSYIPILLKAKELGIYSSFIQGILERLGYEDLESHPGYTLKVTTFGEFQVWLGDTVVLDKDWQRVKAKELFQFLLVHKDTFISKEEIYDHLWPMATEKNIEQEFKVILNSVNKVLEPKRKARSNPFYIQRKENMYRLNPKAVISIDFEEFEHWVQEGLSETDPEKSKSLIMKGLELYKGEFLPTLNLEKINMLREHYKTLFLRGATKLAQIYVQFSQLDDCINWCEKILSLDYTWEEAYRLLMYCHYQKNNRPLAIKYYKQCKQVLAEEFDVEPTEATKQMYVMILGEEEPLVG